MGDESVAGFNLTSGKREIDMSSPLHLIKEKELEISGRVLATRQQAEEIVAEARRKAVEVKRVAEEEGRRLAEGEKASGLSELNLQIEKLMHDAEAEVDSLKVRAAERQGEAVSVVVDVVTRA